MRNIRLNQTIDRLWACLDVSADTDAILLRRFHVPVGELVMVHNIPFQQYCQTMVNMQGRLHVTFN